MLINAKTKGLGLLGHPVSHSFSPAIHNAISASLGLNYTYLAFDVEPRCIEDSVKGLSALGFVGCNVTVPHKTTVIPFLTEISKEAKIIGAVNTISFDKNRLIGYNTDSYGFSKMLEDESVDLKGKKVLIMGAGGAARAVVASCIIKESSQIHVCSRDKNKSDDYVKVFDENLSSNTKMYSLTYNDLNSNPKKFDVVVNCTPLGMHPHEDKTPVDVSIFDQSTVLVDLIYNPYHTEFLKQGIENGMKVVNGLGMLVHQALEAYRIWTGKTETAEFVMNALRENGIIHTS